MKKTVFILLLFIGMSYAQSEKFTPEMALSSKYVSSPAIAPNGEYAAFLLRIPADENHGKKYRDTELYVMDLNTREMKLYSSQSVSNVRWSADSRHLYFLSKRESYNKKRQIYKMPLYGGEAFPVTNYHQNISQFELSPDGEKIAFRAARKKTDKELAAEKNGKDWIINESDFTFVYLYIFDIPTGNVQRITPEDLHVFDFTWEPDGNHLIYLAATSGMVDYSYMFRDIFRVSVNGSENKKLVDHDGKLEKIAVSPDGKYLAFMGGIDISDPQDGSVMLTKIGSGEWSHLTDGFIGTATDIDWNDDQTIIITAETYNHTSVYQMNISNNKMKQIFGKGAIFKSVDIAADGRKFVTAAHTYYHPYELYYGDLKKKNTKRFTFSNPILSEVKFFPLVDFNWKARDGVEISGLVVKPENFTADGTAPLYVYVHGGPESARHSGWNNTYRNWPQIMAQKGCVVFIPNYRGSTGRGVQFAKADQADMMGVDFDDVLDGIDALIDLNWVDAERVGITGGSYGGYMSAWAATRHSERFAAAVMRAGISNQISKLGMTDTPHENALVHWTEYHWQTGFDLAWERSPLKYIKNHKTPLLIAHGEGDKRVPAGQAYELFRALDYLDQAPVKLIIYPDEKHGLRMRSHRAHYMEKGLQWFDTYLINKK